MTASTTPSSTAPSSTVRRLASTAAAASLLLATAACGSDNSSSADADDDTATTATSAATSDSSAATAGAFKPGEYKALGTYQTPGGQESIDVEATLSADGTVTDLDVDGNASGGNSEMFQDKFESGIDALVVGKKITELKVDKVSGSSLTGNGFNNAIAKIIAEAKA